MTDISRREALLSLGAVSMATFLELSPTQVERALEGMTSLAEAPEEEQQQFAPKFFTASEWRTVRVLVDYIIPRDSRSGSATDAKVPEFMDWLLADSEASETSKVAMRGGLAWLNQESRKRFGRPFALSTDAQRRQILDDIAWPARARPEMAAGVTFFNRFRDMTAGGFFSSAIGWKDLPYIGNVAVAEWKGCPEAALRKLGVSYDLMNTRIPVQNGER